MSLPFFSGKFAASAVVLALGTLAAFPATAITVSSITNLGDLSGNTFNLFNSFGSPGSFGLSFDDTYVFDLSQAAQTGGTSVTFAVNFGGNGLALSNMTFTLLDSAFNVLGSDSQALSGNTLSVNSLLGPGIGYRFVVTGDVTGNLGGSYSGLVAAVPVPEAETWALMLAGLGLVSLMARRRNKAS